MSRRPNLATVTVGQAFAFDCDTEGCGQPSLRLTVLRSGGLALTCAAHDPRSPRAAEQPGETRRRDQ